MRPLTLRMSGLRSYRSDVTIDFGDPGLIAIVGDTGAGKSSILEALFFVLYGGCTWDHRAVVPLISEGSSVMQVELTFLADGRRWRVFRSASRTGGQSRHELECLDDPAVRFDNDGPVSAEIRRLIGLDRDAFLRTVILPQGRFQMLLQATRADRTAILKGIFRLEQLAAARDQADSTARRLRPEAEQLRAERAALLPDPAAALAVAQDRHDQARAHQELLHGLSQTITVAARQRDDATLQATDLQVHEHEVEASALPHADTDLAALAATALRLDQQRQQADDERRGHRVREAALAGQLQGAADQGEGIEQLASAASTIVSLSDQLPAIDADTARCEQEAAELHQLSQAVDAQENNAAGLRAQATDAHARITHLADAARTADEQLGRARQLLAAMRAAETALTGLREEEHAAAVAQEAAQARLEVAALEAQETANRRDAAQSVVEEIRRADAAAHAAEECQPGDACPICRRPLPADFRPPAPPGDADARNELAAAERTAQEATNQLAGSEAKLGSATERIQRANHAASEAAARFSNALTELGTALPRDVYDSNDDTLLAPLADALSVATELHRAAADEAARLAENAAGAGAKASQMRAQLDQQRDQLRDHRESVRLRKESCETAAASLPVTFAISGQLTTDSLAAVSQRIAERRAQLAEVDRQLTQARQAADQAADELQRIADTRRSDVDEPAGQLLPRLTVAAQRLTDLNALLGLAAPPTRPSGGLAEDAQWAGQLCAATATSIELGQRAAAELSQTRERAETTISNALASAGVADEAGLQQTLIETSAILRRAADDIQTATTQLPRAAELDDQIQRAQALLTALDELARLLADGKFVAFVVARKQLTLLAVATEILGSMTAGRYGFSEAFEIIDRLTGLPRGVKTLSGGETFLASLALALGLVELAGRGGGRLDAFFLDEGFGSLDANSLADALDALGRQADTGRLVAVISHIRSVAETMDRVLAITVRPEGSSARWLGGTERDELIVEDIEAGLLT